MVSHSLPRGQPYTPTVLLQRTCAADRCQIFSTHDNTCVGAAPSPGAAAWSCAGAAWARQKGAAPHLELRRPAFRGSRAGNLTKNFKFLKILREKI